jgi:hypothetical protein
MHLRKTCRTKIDAEEFDEEEFDAEAERIIRIIITRIAIAKQ